MIDGVMRASEPVPVLTLDEVLDRLRSAVDIDWCDRMYDLQLRAAGYHKAEDLAVARGLAPRTKGALENPLYPDIEPADMGAGVQNHLFQDSRISAMTVTGMVPDWNVQHRHPLVREFNRAYLETVWQDGDWGTKQLEIGLDVNVCGLGLGVLGVDRYQGVNLWRVSPLDAMVDPYAREPHEWEFVAVRHLMAPWSAYDRYKSAGVTRQDVDRATVSVSSRQGSRTTGAYRTIDVVPVWSFYSDSTHCVFVGTVSDGPCLIMGDDRAYRTVDRRSKTSPKMGANPFGILPLAGWTETFLPHVRRPVSKMSFQAPLARLLQHIEQAMSDTVVHGKPVNIMSTVGLEQETLRAIKEAKELGETGRLILVDALEAINAHIHRVPAAEIPMSWIQVRDVLMQNSNTASGTSDYQRGQLQPGERTRFEMEFFAESSGAQAKHTRRRYAAYLTELGLKTRHIASMYDKRRRIVGMKAGDFDTSQFPAGPLLSVPVRLVVSETSLEFQSRAAREEKRKREFQEIDLPLMSAGVLDPMRVAASIYRDLGVVDLPERGLMTQEDLEAKAQLAAQQQAAATMGLPTPDAGATGPQSG